MFDDPAVGLVREPFVAGIHKMIDQLVASIPNAEHGFRFLFSATPFPDQTEAAVRGTRRQLVFCLQFGIEGWLCLACFRYFDKAPRSAVFSRRDEDRRLALPSIALARSTGEARVTAA